jgi:hypothetical protein
MSRILLIWGKVGVGKMPTFEPWKARVQLWYLQIVEVKVRVVFLGKVGVGKSWHLPIVQSWEIWSWLGSKL